MSETQTEKVVENTKTELTFPRSISRIVFVRRKKMAGIILYTQPQGDELDDSKIKIGSAFRFNAPLSGLTKEEEKKFLKDILSLSPDSPNWEKATRDYWANISREVPAGDGLRLETGLHYNSKSDYDADQKAQRTDKGAIINPKGVPLNLADYILWRYCLEYSHVAANIEDIYKSPKITFYLYSKEKEIVEKSNSLKLKKQAIQLLYQRTGERDWVDNILRVLVALDKTVGKSINIKDLPTMVDDEKDIVLHNYVETNPSRFIAIANDKNLEIKAFIESCVAQNLLQRIPNTETILLESTPLGNSMDEVVAYLTNKSNATTYTTLKSQLKFTP